MSENKCYTALKWKQYSLNAWTNKGKNNSVWLKYEIQNNVFLGIDKTGKKNWSNQSLSLTKLEDLCYLKTLIRYLILKNNENPLQKSSFICKKIVNENQKLKWKDKENPTKEELRQSLTLIHFFRIYDKDGKTQETKRFIIKTSEIDILRDFVLFCISQIDKVIREFEPYVFKKESNSQYQDNINYSQSETQNEFIDEKLDDEISF